MLVPAAEYGNQWRMPLLAPLAAGGSLSRIFRRSNQCAASAGAEGPPPVTPSAQPRAMQQRSWFSIQSGADLGTHVGSGSNSAVRGITRDRLESARKQKLGR